jgi:hypothetical protein
VALLAEGALDLDLATQPKIKKRFFSVINAVHGGCGIGLVPGGKPEATLITPPTNFWTELFT